MNLTMAPHSSNSVLKMLLGCGAASAILRTGSLLVIGAMTPGYSHLNQFNSELSAMAAPFQAEMTWILYLVGMLTALFGIGLFRALRPSKVAMAGAAIIFLSGLGFLAIGAFPCDPGCSLANPSATMKLHMLSGFGAMSLQTLALVVFSFYSPGAGASRYLTNTSRILGIAAVLGMVWLFAAYGGMGQGLPHPAIAQKIYTLATDLWFLLAALFLLRNRA